MTGHGDVSRETPSTWREYQDIISHVRSQYLATVQAAREQREATTGYAFDEFAAVERRAWHTYHEAGRRAWANYQASQQEQPPPLPAPAPDATGAGTQWAKKTGYRLPSPPPDSYPYPAPQSVVVTTDLQHGQATFTPYPEGAPLDYPAAHREWHQAPDHNPGSGLNGEPDQWPGNYLAAPPNPESGQ